MHATQTGAPPSASASPSTLAPGDAVEGFVQHAVQGGFLVDIGRPRPVFVPGHLLRKAIELLPGADRFEEIVRGRPLSFVVGRLSRRPAGEGDALVLPDEMIDRIHRRRVLANMRVGERTEGTVLLMRRTGYFVRVDRAGGSVDGFVLGDASMRVVGEKIALRAVSISRERLYLTEMPEPGAVPEVGEKFRGRVTQSSKNGLLVVGPGNVVALVPRDEISWVRDGGATTGDEVETVVIRKLGDPDDEADVEVSLKRARKNPWDEIADGVTPGSVVSGVVTNVVDFGAFVLTDWGVSGLVHASALGLAAGSPDLYALFPRGKRIDLTVLSVDAAARRLGLLPVVGAPEESVAKDQAGTRDKAATGEPTKASGAIAAAIRGLLRL